MSTPKKVVGVPGLRDRVPAPGAAAPKPKLSANSSQPKAAPRAKDKRQRATGVRPVQGKKAAAVAAAPKRVPESEWTLNGQPIPEHLRGSIPFRLTDQGFEEFNRGKVEARASVTSDPLDKIIRQREDATEPWEMPDPMKELAAEHVPAGYRPRFLSPRMIEVYGMRGHEAVIDKQGDPVRVGRMILGQMPEDRAQRHDAYLATLAAEPVREAAEQFNVKTERMLRDAPAAAGGDFAPLKSGTRVKDYEFETEGEIGLRTTRGNAAEA